MINLLDQIAKVDVALDTGVVSTSSINNILIVGPAPASEEATAAEVQGYSNLADAKWYGWVDGDPCYDAMKVAFAQQVAIDKVFVAYYSAEETPVDALERAGEQNGWYCICPVGITDGDVLTQIADWVESTERICIYAETRNEVASVSAEDYSRTTGIFCKTTVDEALEDIPANNRYANVAWSVVCSSYAPGSETWAHKTLTGIKSSKLSSRDMEALKRNNITYYIDVGKNVTIGGAMLSGEWIDVIRFRDWLKANIQNKIVAVKTSVPKVPFSDSGIAVIGNAVTRALAEGLDNGGIAESTVDSEGNVVPSYIVTLPKSTEISDSDKQKRILTGIRFSARLAGAIHLTEVKGRLTYSL